MNAEKMTCPACQGDGWGIEGDELVVRMIEGSCLACEGIGTYTPDETGKRRLRWVLRHYERMGWT